MLASSIQTAQIAVGDKVAWQDGVEIPKKWFNPSWLRRAARWRKFRVCYLGGDDFLCSSNPVTLHSHERESLESYNHRKIRASYRNHVETIIGVKADAIYQPQVLRGQQDGKPDEIAVEVETPPAPPAPGSTPPKPQDEPRVPVRRQEADPTFEAFLRDVDGRGTNADPFWNEVARWAMAQGVRWVEIGMASDPALSAKLAKEGRKATVAEAKAAKLGTVLRSIPTEAVIDWSEDDRGRLEYVTILCREEKRAPLLGQRDEAPKAKLIARILTRDQEFRYEIGEKNGKLPVPGFPAKHDFGEVPVVRVEVRSEGRSEVEDIADMAIAVFNYDALIDEQIYRQTFNQLVGKTDDATKFMDNVSGTDAIVTIDREDSLDYLAPQVQTVTVIQERAREFLDEMYALANLRSRNGGKGTQPAVDVSGIAYAFESKNAETDLANTATRLEEAEQKLLTMRARALGLAVDGVVVQYPRQFDVRALQARAAEQRALKDAGVPDLALAEGLKDLVRKAWPRLTAAKLAAIDAQIDAAAKAGKLSTLANEARPGNGQTPPNQSQQPPGKGAGEDRVGRSFKPDDEVDDDDLAFEEREAA